ncbi:MAG: endonuclease III [Candidatus Hydrogenedentes bacterium]|nr:endonuclease III [Candidatus Hydrogenedentota bacterium]
MARKTVISQKEKERAVALFEIFRETYPEVRCTLDYRSPFQLLVMTILAAQCTDARVNVVCSDLFKRFKNPRDFAETAPGVLEEAIRSCGFFNQKARSIRESARMLLDEYNGEVPADMEALLRLPGVGRKIANAVLGECFGVQGVIVDTHCRRVTNRLGFTRHQDPTKIERDLMALWPPEHWTIYSHYMVFHGRAVCQARSPKCAACPARELCLWPKKNVRKTS